MAAKKSTKEKYEKAKSFGKTKDGKKRIGLSVKIIQDMKKEEMMNKASKLPGEKQSKATFSGESSKGWPPKNRKKKK